MAEVEVKRSRFLGYLVPYCQFTERLNALKAEHPKANHHVTAFRFVNEYGQIIEGSRDDGEPAGTSGPPALKVLQGNDLVDAGLIIVRYFGGTKLGTGGLARAYALAASTVIGDTPPVPWQKTGEDRISLGFADLSGFEHDCSNADLTITDRSFTADGVDVTFSGEESALKAILLKWQTE